jgi:hypothetical protein
MKHLYEIDDLVRIFQKHYEDSIESDKRFHQEYPNSIGKPYDETSFHITLALKSMCEDLIRLEKWISRVEDKIDNHYD